MADADVWNDLVGDAWVRHEEAIDARLASFGDRAIDQLHLTEGGRAVDVGCGSGRTTFALAARVGPRGHVTGLDLSRPMLARARRVAAERRVDNVEFVVADAATANLEPGQDAVFSRFGVMFFTDPVAAFARLRGALRTGGRLGFACWRHATANPWMTVPVTAAAPIVGPPAQPPPGAPGPFSLADPDHVRDVLTAAGFADISLDELTQDRPMYGTTPEAAAQTAVEISTTLAAALLAAPERRVEVLRAIADALRPYERDGRVVVSASAWIVTATRT